MKVSPAAREQLGAQGQEALRQLWGPEGTWRFEPQVKHTPDGALDTTTAAGHRELAKASLLQALLIASEIVVPFAERRGIFLAPPRLA